MKFVQTDDNAYVRHWFRWYLLLGHTLLEVHIPKHGGLIQQREENK